MAGESASPTLLLLQSSVKPFFHEVSLFLFNMLWNESLLPTFYVFYASIMCLGFIQVIFHDFFMIFGVVLCIHRW